MGEPVWLIRKATGAAPFDSEQASIVGPDTETVEVVSSVRVAALTEERDEARVRLGVFRDIADETIRDGRDAPWFRSLLAKRLSDLGPEYEVQAFLRVMREHDEAERRAARVEAALADIVRADTAKWESRTAHVHSVALNNAIARARSVLASSGPGDGTPDA